MADSDGVTYTLEVATTGDRLTTGRFAADDLVFTLDSIPTTQFTLTGDLETGDYIWHVQAVDGAGNSGDFSTGDRFTVAEDLTVPPVPALISPADGAFINTGAAVQFQWTQVVDLPSASTSDVSYTLEVATTGDRLATGRFVTGDVVFTADGIQTTQLTLPDDRTLASGYYIWHVRAVDGAGNTSDFSTADTFNVDTTRPGAPVLVSPPDDSSGDGRTPTFEWRQVAGDLSGVTYILEVDDTAAGDFTAPVFVTGDIPDVPATGDIIRFTLADANALDTGDYVWRVRAVDGAGNSGDPSTADFTVLPDTTAPPAPVLVAPSDGSTGDDTTPTFTWVQVTGDTSGLPVTYTLEIATMGDPQTTGGFATDDLVFALDSIQTAQFTLTGDLETGDYIWHVQAVDAAGNSGDFSTADRFIVTGDTTAPPAPVLVAPLDDSTGDDRTPTFTWVQVAEDTSGLPVTSYTLEIATTGDPLTTGGFNAGDLVFALDSIQTTQFTLTDDLETGDYIWHVRAVDAANNTGDFSNSSTFTVEIDETPPAKPELISPGVLLTGDLTSGDILSFDLRVLPPFRWARVTDDEAGGVEISGVTYTLEIAFGTADFSDVRFSRRNIADPGTGDVVFTLPAFVRLDTGDHLWRVRAEDGADNVGEFSDPFIFSVDPDTNSPAAPVLVSPPSNFEFEFTGDGVRVTFKWVQVTDDISGTADSSGVASYTLEIGSVDFTNVVFIRTGIPSPPGTGDVVFTGDALPIGDYIWHVQAVDGVGNSVDFSTAATFDVADTRKPGIPLLDSPATGDIAESARPTFTWTGTGDPSGVTYNLRVSTTTGDFSILDQLVINVGGLRDTSFRPATQLSGGTFDWRVVAVDGVGNTADSGQRSFTIIGTPQTLTVKPFPATGGTITYVPTFEWDVVTVSGNAITADAIIHYEARVDNGPFRDIGVGIRSGNKVLISGDSIDFGPHHVFQVRAVTTGSTVAPGSKRRGGIATIFFSDNLPPANSAVIFGIPEEDFLPLGQHKLQVRALDRAGNESVPAPGTGELTFNVSQLLIRLVPRTSSVTLPTSSTPLTIQIDPLGLEVAGVVFSIDVESPLVFGGVSTGGGIGEGVTIVQIGTSDYEATFSATVTGLFNVATIQINTPSVVPSPEDENVVFVNTEDRKTVGRSPEGVEMQARRSGAFVTVNPAPVVGQPPSAAPANQDPTADASATPTTVDEGGEVSFSGSSSADPDGSIASFDWAFGIGEGTEAGESVSHTYADGPASPTVTLTVTDDAGATDTDTLTITVNNVDPTITSVVATPSELPFTGGSSTIAIAATDPAGANDPLQYSFDCDGVGGFEVGPQGGSSATCTFTDADEGSSTVNVQVDDGDGGVTPGSTTVTVAAPPEPIAPTADAGDAQTVVEGTQVAFNTLPVNGRGSFDPDGSIVSFLWDFGLNEGTADGPIVTHTYTDGPVARTVTLTVTDDGDPPLSATDTAVITVTNAAPIVVTGDDRSINEGDSALVSATFTDVGVDDTHAATISWGDPLIDDTTVDPAVSPVSEENVYPDDAGSPFTVTITVTDKDGDSGSGNLSVTVANVAPVVEAGGNQSVLEGASVELSATFTDAGTRDTHTATIDWGDVTPPVIEAGTVLETGGSGTVSGSHTYALEGDEPQTFTVTVTVDDGDGGVNTDTLQVTVLPAVTVDARIEVSNLVLLDPDTGTPTSTRVAGEFIQAQFDVENITDPPAEISVSIPFFVNGDLEGDPF